MKLVNAWTNKPADYDKIAVTQIDPCDASNEVETRYQGWHLPWQRNRDEITPEGVRSENN